MTTDSHRRGRRSSTGRHWITEDNRRIPLTDDATIDQRAREPAFVDPEPTIASDHAHYVATHRAYDEVSAARKHGIEEGRAQAWDRIWIWFTVVSLAAFALGLLAGRHLP